MKFVKKPQMIEPARYYSNQEIKGVCYEACGGQTEIQPHVHTTHKGQVIYLEEGDWIVPESDGNGYYAVKDYIFRKLYNPIDDEAEAAFQR